MSNRSVATTKWLLVSMKSGLEGRNNRCRGPSRFAFPGRLNEVRPRRPEQSHSPLTVDHRNNGLNEVRPRRPEQFGPWWSPIHGARKVSMKSGLEGRNNTKRPGMMTVNDASQ